MEFGSSAFRAGQFPHRRPLDRDAYPGAEELT